MREYRKRVQTGEDSANFCFGSWFLTFDRPFPKRLYDVGVGAEVEPGNSHTFPCCLDSVLTLKDF